MNDDAPARPPGLGDEQADARPGDSSDGGYPDDDDLDIDDTPRGEDAGLDVLPDAGPGPGPGGGGGRPDIRFAWIAKNVLSSCGGARCHGGGSQGDRDVSPLRAYDDLVGRPSRQARGMNLIEPGTPEESYLYLKVVGAHSRACAERDLPLRRCGDRMPPRDSRHSLSPGHIARLGAWIEAGARR